MSAARGFPAFPPRPGRRGRSWWARAFVAAMEDAALDAVLLRRGRRFAGSGRVGPISVSPGRIAAVVEDPDAIYDVAVHLTELTAAEWDRFLDQVGAEAGHLAALLDGEVPRSLVRSADAAGVPLLPTIGDLESDCDCPEIGDPCQHAAALCYQVAWLLDDDPFLLLLLRGRDPDELLDALGERRAGPAPSAAREDDAAGTVDRPVPAAAAYATVPAPLPPALPDPSRPTDLGLPAAPGLPPDALALLVADAALRARELLAHPGSTAAPTAWSDAVRWAAIHPVTAERVAASAGRDTSPAARAWALGGATGLAALERAGAEPTAEEAAAEGRETKARRGPDGRWYPFRRQDGVWWPAGPPDHDLAVALDGADA